MSSPNPPSSYISHSANSSVSTYASKSTRLSQSSASSLGTSPPSEEEHEEYEQVLMVQDTGATPTMSPNPAFNSSQSQRKADEEGKVPISEAEDDFFSAPKIVSRSTTRDRGRPMSSSHSSPSSSRSESPTKRSGIPPSSPSSNATPSSTFVPVSSMPGLALSSVTAGGISWMGSVGKKWGELQKGTTFSKNQKRASLLLSDAAQSIAHALSSPPLISSALSVSPLASSTLSPSPASTSVSSLSLLDEDVDMGAGQSMKSDQSSNRDVPNILPIMKPTKLPLVTKQQSKQQPPTVSSPLPSAKAKQDLEEEEDEWNW